MLPCTGRMMTLSPVRSSSATLGGGSSDSREPLRLGTLRGQDHHRGTLSSTRDPTATLCGAVPLTVGDRHCRCLDFGDAATFPFPEPLPQQPLDGVRRWLPCHPWMGLSTPEKGGLGLWGGGGGAHLDIGELGGGGGLAIGASPSTPGALLICSQVWRGTQHQDPPPPLPAPQAPQHHARLEKGQDTPIRNAPSPGNINQSWKKDPGTLSWVPNPASTSQYLQPGDAAKLWVLKMGAHGRKGEGGRRMYPAAPAPVHGASAQPRRSAPVLRCRAPIQDGPHPGAMRVPAPVPAWG